MDTLNNSKIIKNLDLGINNFKPRILIIYNREYLKSKIYDFRLTIDKDIKFYRIKGSCLNKIFYNYDKTVLELKYPANHSFQEVSNINIPFRITKHSKYVNGMNYINY